MRLFSFLNKKKPVEKKVEEKKNFTIEDIEFSLNNKKEEGKLKEKDITKKIESLINEFSSELTAKNEKLKKVDLAKKEENQNVKDLVLENVKTYSTFVDELITTVKEIKEENLQKLINEINKKFINFERTSKFSFSRANFLVGREIVATKESVKSFFDQLNEILNENKTFLENLTKIHSLEKKILELKKEQEAYEAIKIEVRAITIKKLELERKKEVLTNQFLEMKESEEYAEKNIQKEKAFQEKKNIDRDIFKIKSSINWKKLVELFHSSKKKMDILKSYEQDFNKILFHDEEFIIILKEANIETEGIISELEDIKKKKKEIEEIISQKDELVSLQFIIDSNESELKDILIKEEKISKKLYESEEKISKVKEIINEESQFLF